ncbi:MAG TPA: PLP-dependent aminotransferase family protein [Candidatus Dormibacteraeota bacterium]
MSDSSSIQRLAASLRSEAAALDSGSRLPSTRELVARHGVSPVTVSRALAALAAEGLVTTRPGAGTFVAPSPPAAHAAPVDMSWQTVALGDRAIDGSRMSLYLDPPAPGVISLGSGYLHPSLLPTRLLASALARVARRPDIWDRPPLGGVVPLRTWFADLIGGGVTAEDVLITSGGQSALSAAVRATVPAGAPLLVESPTYLGALAVAWAAGVRPVPVPVDGRGIRPDLLAETFAMTGARAVYVQPAFQNPTGAVLGAERRAEVLAVASAAGAFVIEDDYARWLAHQTPAPPPLLVDDREGRVVLITSLTKPVAPSMRVGALVARGPVAERLRGLRLVDDLFVARPVQETALELVSSPGWARHIAGLRVTLRLRRDALLDAIAEHAPALRVASPPRGGMHVWARLPDGTDEAALGAAASQQGVIVSLGRAYFAAEPPAPHVRLSFASAAHLDDLREAVRRFATALVSVA